MLLPCIAGAGGGQREGERTMPHARVNGIDLYYEVAGTSGGDWITFSNSLRLDHTMWAPQVREFSADHRVLTYDVRGHGQSEATEGPYSTDLLCADLIGLWDHLGIAKSHFVGLSLGGMMGMRLGMEHAQRIDRLVICDCRGASPEASVESWRKRADAVRTNGMEHLVKSSIDGWFDDDYRQRNGHFVAALGRTIAETDPRGYIGCATGILSNLDMAARIAEIRTPTLFVVGSADGEHPEMMSQMHAGLPGSRYALIEGATHVSNLSHEKEFNAAVRQFLMEG
jgi:3-oxoadipate enol-lactonase